MSKITECEIIRDLLPSYADGLTTPASSRAVKEHISECADCAEALRLMMDPQQQSEEKNEQTDQIDYLKKVRSRSRKRSAFAGILLSVLALGIFGFRIFYVGTRAKAQDVSIETVVEGSHVILRARMNTSTQKITRMSFSDSAGMVQAMVYTAPKTLFGDDEFTAEYEAAGDIGRVRIDDIIIWEQGVTISPEVGRLYSAANVFVGDMPSNADIAELLGLGKQFGAYENELQTENEPYGWTIKISAKLSERSESSLKAKMSADSCMMLALIENLGYVNWEYRTDEGVKTFSVSEQEAGVIAGQDIKKCADSVIGIQKLWDMLNIW